MIAVCSQIHTKHNTLYGHNVEFVNVKLAVHIVTTGLYMVQTTHRRLQSHDDASKPYVSLELPHSNTLNSVRPTKVTTPADRLSSHDMKNPAKEPDESAYGTVSAQQLNSCSAPRCVWVPWHSLHSIPFSHDCYPYLYPTACHKPAACLRLNHSSMGTHTT